MTWESAKKEKAKSGFVVLKEDGQTTNVTFLSEPSPVRRPGLRGPETLRFYFYVYEDGEIKTLDTSGETLGRIENLPEHGLYQRFTMTRHGVPGDKKTWYEFTAKPLSDAERKYLVETILPSLEEKDVGDDVVPF